MNDAIVVGGCDRLHPEVDQSLYAGHRTVMSLLVALTRGTEVGVAEQAWWSWGGWWCHCFLGQWLCWWRRGW